MGGKTPTTQTNTHSSKHATNFKRVFFDRPQPSTKILLHFNLFPLSTESKSSLEFPTNRTKENPLLDPIQINICTSSQDPSPTRGRSNFSFGVLFFIFDQLIRGSQWMLHLPRRVNLNSITCSSYS